MNELLYLLDAAMCLLWMATYTLVLIGTIKYRYPLISPITQAIIAPLELSCLILVIRANSFQYSLSTVAYAYWTVIEIAIFFVILKYGFIRKAHMASYLGLVAVITCIMIYLVTVKGYVLFFTYFNTLVGQVFWLGFIAKHHYPTNPIALTAFVLKLVADVLAVPVYFGKGFWATDVMCLALPALELIFIVVYLFRKRQKSTVSYVQ